MSLTATVRPDSDKLHLGCGHEILSGWINHDVAALEGVDVVHDLAEFPWPFESDRFSEIRLINVLEHLPETVRSIEELHRISRPGCKVTIRVPYWNSPDMITDPTHRAWFNERTFNFFDPGRLHNQERPYYSKARFRIEHVHTFVRVLGHYLRIRSPLLNSFLFYLARYLGAIVWVMEFELTALKPTPAG